MGRADATVQPPLLHFLMTLLKRRRYGFFPCRRSEWCFYPRFRSDAGMIHANEGYLDITKLESMTAVCSAGLDMIVVPVTSIPEVISGNYCR